MSKDKVKIHVLYCGGWGYKRKFNALAKELEQVFPDQLEFEGVKGKGTTGEFEINIVDENGDKTLLHSKRNGDGYPVDKKLQNIILQIMEYLADMKKEKQ